LAQDESEDLIAAKIWRRDNRGATPGT